MSPASYWTMNFDASPRTLQSLSGVMRHDPRVIRMTTLKAGEKAEDIVRPKTKTLRTASQAAMR